MERENIHEIERGMMGLFSTDSNASEMSLSAIIIKADGTRVDLGEIAYYNKSFWKGLRRKVEKWLRQ